MRTVFALVDGHPISEQDMDTRAAIRFAVRLADDRDQAIDVCTGKGETRIYPACGGVRRMPRVTPLR